MGINKPILPGLGDGDVPLPSAGKQSVPVIKYALTVHSAVCCQTGGRKAKTFL